MIQKFHFMSSEEIAEIEYVPIANPISPKSFNKLVSISVILRLWCVHISFICCNSEEALLSKVYN